MNKRDRDALGRYCRALADRLHLRDWTVHVTVAEPDSPVRQDGREWGATSESLPGRKHVRLTFAPDVRDWSRSELRETVVHELVHPHFAPLMEIVREDLYEHLARPTYQLLHAGATRWLEYGVDAMAEALAPHQPLIDWPA